MKNSGKKLRVGIVGAGNIGGKRAVSIKELGADALAGVFDIDAKKARALASAYHTKVYPSWQALLKDPTINCVVVATTTNVNGAIVKAAIKAGKHILAEKPLGKNSRQAKEFHQLSQKAKLVLKVGFNHRHHPAIFKAYELVKKGAVGNLLYIRSVYGHGARPGYDTEWRMKKKYSPGGELFDQGVHIIDLANWFMGGFKKVFAQTRNFYWKKSPLEDNAFCQLLSGKGQIVDFHASLTQWKNKFSFEIFGNKGYLLINGLGKSYGTETLTFGTQVGGGRPPKEEIFVYEGADISWREEWLEFRNAVLGRRQPLANAKDNFEVNKILEALYVSARQGKIIKL